MITTILMTLVITMLVLTMMQAVFMYLKINQHRENYHDSFYRLENIAHKLVTDRTTRSSSPCLFTDTNPNEIVAALLNNQECTITYDGQRFNYLIDDLGILPCIKISVHGEFKSSHHWLISVATLRPRVDILQIRVAIPANDLSCEFDELPIINTGVISWRYLAAYER